jgi:redox-sensitive bicupin YhaK (pirin superfamily)
MIEPGQSFIGNLPADFTTFLYVLEGEVQVGDDAKVLSRDQVAWLDKYDQPIASQVKLRAGNAGVHLVLYAAQPQHHEIVSHGPFIADSMDDIRQLYSNFRAGKMEHITEVPAEQQMSY